jgi:uncharacterized protein YjbI with pentapeptide repeats
MANDRDLTLLRDGGVKAWNNKRAARRGRPEEDLSGADLTEIDLRGADLSHVDLSDAKMQGCDLSGANLVGALLSEANLSRANLAEVYLKGGLLTGADLTDTDLSKKDLQGARLEYANLTNAKLTEADLSRANLDGARLRGANLNASKCFFVSLRNAELTGAQLSRSVMMGCSLNGADLSEANLIGAVLTVADLTGANLTEADLTMASIVAATVEGATFLRATVYGLAAWDLRGVPADQADLVITPHSQAPVTVDSLNVAQFVYLLLNNANVRDIVDTLTSKVVLILGRFSKDRKPVLDTLRQELRRFDRTPIVFDFSKPSSRGYAETVTVLARLARYVIADLTDAAEVRSELIQIVPTMPRLPVQPILLSGASQYETYVTDIKPYPWVLPIYRYESVERLVESLQEEVLNPLEAMRRQDVGTI